MHGISSLGKQALASFRLIVRVEMSRSEINRARDNHHINTRHFAA